MSAAPAPERRLVIYALARANRHIDDHVSYALAALRQYAERIVVVLPAGTVPDNAASISDFVDEVIVSSYASFDPKAYAWALDQEKSLADFDDVILTGDAWFGPVIDIAPAMRSIAASAAPVRAMVEVAAHPPEAFPDAGYPAVTLPWTWTAVRKSIVMSSAWEDFWSSMGRAAQGYSQERAFLDQLAAAGHEVSVIFPGDLYASSNPAVFSASRLIDDGYPFLGRGLFSLYPPYLDRFAVIGRDVIDHVVDKGFPAALLWQSLARTLPPKGLYAISGALEILPVAPKTSYDREHPLRLAAIVHVGDLDRVPGVLDRLAFLPEQYDLYLTTTDGKRAAQLQRLVEGRADSRIRSFDIRVTPASHGRDMSDFFVGCRDVLMDTDLDVVVKLHTRKMPRKTTNVQRYFRRYQFENLLDSPSYTSELLAMFQREEGLGFVFPPMMHIGYATMGRGWADLQGKAQDLADRLGIRVPQDSVSPLAPYGGMFFARPRALTLLSSERWRYGDYGRKGTARYRHLAHLQERMIVSAGAELGFHTRTVLTAEHASISHTALESKTDYLFSTTRGWPVEQISLMQRAGDTGHGGSVALARMYVRLNHRRASRVLMPVFALALRTVLTLRLARAAARGIFSALLGRS